MNKNSLFTIAIPAYKSKFLGEAIESCLSQTYSNFEVVIVDDASPEDLKSVVDRFHDDRIRFYRNEKNCGAVDVVDNWNNVAYVNLNDGKEFFNVYNITYTEQNMISLKVDSEFLKILKNRNSIV